MNKELALKIINGISVVGMLFSGYLSYSEIFTKVCAIGGCSILGGVPACVYGFFMYLLVFIVSLIGILSKK